MKKLFAKINLAMLAVMAWSATAFGADDPFSKMTDKGTSILEQAEGPMVIICAIAIVAAMVGGLLGKLSRGWCISIIACSIIAGSATSIAQFLIGN